MAQANGIDGLKQLVPPAVKRSLRRGLHRVKQIDPRERALPGFIIIGAQKCGTSSLYNYLAQHPQLCPASKKEVHYFDNGLERGQDHYLRGPGWYAAHFPLRSAVPDGGLSFEASPMYCFHPEVPQRIHAMDPGERLVFMVRNPVDRAISHYYHEVRNGREALPLERALREEEERTAAVLRAADYLDPRYKNCTYKRRGHYAEQMQRYLQYFPAEQLHIIGSEEFFAEPQRVLRELYVFLGVDADFEVPDLKPVNVNSIRKQVDDSARSYLQAYFADHNARFFELIGRELDW